MRTSIGRLLACVLVVVAVAGCGARKPPQIIVVNNSTTTLTNILLYGNGFKQVISKIEPNESTSVTVVPAGESSVSMEAVLPFKTIRAKDVGYFERSGGYKVQITVTEDYNIETTVDLSAML